MSFLIPLTLFSWPLVTLWLFAVLPTRRAVLVSLLGAWMFLPLSGYAVEGLPNYTKMTAACLGALLGAAVFAPQALLTFRFSIVDLPILVWCGSPLLSSVANDLGVYDGLAGVLARTVEWGAPYLVGRLYFRDVGALNELARALVIGGLLYVPLCLYEIKMSPQLRFQVYGPDCNAWWDTSALRNGGWRPVVFMQSPLAVGMWMATATLAAWWLWRAGGLKKIARLPAGGVAAGLLVTSFLCKAFGALVLLVCGLAVLHAAGRWRSATLFLVFILAPVGYMVSRTVGGWKGAELITAASMVSDDRSGSLATRIHNENLFAPHALQRPLFGWGGWGRNRPSGVGQTIADGQWIIALGTNGLVGLGALTAVQLLPAFLFLRRRPPRTWGDVSLAAPAAISAALVMNSLDSLTNAMFNPVFVMMSGALSSACVGQVWVGAASMARGGQKAASGGRRPAMNARVAAGGAGWRSTSSRLRA